MLQALLCGSGNDQELVSLGQGWCCFGAVGFELDFVGVGKL